MVSVSDLSKKYGKKTVLNNVSFSASKGECVGIVGANGSGKSTLLSIMSGTLKSDCGNIRYNQKDIIKQPKYISELVGYVPQDNPLIHELSVKDNLRLWYCDSLLDMHNELENGVLKLLGLNEILRIPVSKLSGGMKKRVSIGCAVANNPPILLLDEPSSALDLLFRESIHQYLSDYRKKGGTIVIVTHEESELYLCDKLYIMKNGHMESVSKDIRGSKLLHAL